VDDDRKGREGATTRKVGEQMEFENHEVQRAGSKLKIEKQQERMKLQMKW
jgi:hypothetical protein